MLIQAELGIVEDPVVPREVDTPGHSMQALIQLGIIHSGLDSQSPAAAHNSHS